MPFVIISVLLQVFFVIHIVKTGRDTSWIWIVMMLPVAGSIAYVLLELMPSLTKSKAGRQAENKVRSGGNPNPEINDAVKDFSMSDSVENTKQLAEKCFNNGLFDDAKELYKKSLIGPCSHEPSLMYGLAQSDFELGNYKDVQLLLESLIEANPDYKNQNAHLLYARTLENLEETQAALHEYEALHGYFSGPEASYYYATLLFKENESERSKAVLKELLLIAENSSKHYNDVHKEIILKAKNDLAV